MSLAILTGACSATLPRSDRHRFTMLGWLAWSGAGLLKAHPAPAGEPDTAVLVRDASTNALSVVVGPAEDALRRSSHSVRDFQFVLRFMNPSGCASLGRIVLPLDTSNQISLTDFSGGGEIRLTIDATRLGRDLLLSSLFAPGGLTGFAECDGGVVWLRGRAADPRSAYATVWHRQVGGRAQIYIKSQVEYPFALYRVEVGAENTTYTFSGETIVAPWRSAVLEMPRDFSSVPTSISVQGTPQITTPVTYRQYQGEHP
jgi:hypothetical protein